MKQILLIVLLALGILLVGCAQPTPRESPMQSPLPSQTPFESPLVPTVVETSIDGPAFEIEEPLVAGATQVRGKGPYDVPIVIVDVTMTAEPLGSGVIAPDGTFAIDVPNLVANHRIGIVVGVIEGTPVPSPDDYVQSFEPFRGEGYMNLPYIGVVFASSMVQAMP